jgi:hypothetical protein
MAFGIIGPQADYLLKFRRRLGKLPQQAQLHPKVVVCLPAGGAEPNRLAQAVDCFASLFLLFQDLRLHQAYTRIVLIPR